MEADKYLKMTFNEKDAKILDELQDALIVADAHAFHNAWLRTNLIDDERAKARVCESIVNNLHKNEVYRKFLWNITCKKMMELLEADDGPKG